MSDEDNNTYEDQHLKTTVDVGSGDFQPNPIYGDAPPSYAGGTYDQSPQIQQQPQDDDNDENYDYPNNEQDNNDDDDDDDDDDDQNNTSNEDDNQQNHIQQQNPPPPYSEDPPAPPQAYTDQDTTQNVIIYDNDPEDVVAQMNVDDDEDVDYGISQPNVDDTNDKDTENGIGLFGNYFIRTIYIASSILFCSIMSFALWFRKSYGDFTAGWGISAFAAFMLLLGSLMAIAFAVMKKLGRPIPAEKWILWCIIGMYMIGGLFYFLGACAVAYAWNTLKLSYIGGIFFAEQTFVGLHAMVAGVDLWKRQILNNKKWRVIIYNLAFLILCIIAFFSFAQTSTEFDSSGLDNVGPAFLALFYFLTLIPEILYLLIFLIPKLNETLGKPIILLILAGSYLLCVVCILIGYFIITADFIIKGKAYFLGVGFFVLLMGTIISFDMLFDRFIPGYKDGGVSVSDQQQKGDFATVDPDMEDIDME